jgi:hypothetical protein
VLLGFCQARAGQEGVITLTAPTAVGRKVALGAEEVPCAAATVRACQPLAVEVTFQPAGADAIVHQLADRKVNHTAMIAHPARGLYMRQIIWSMHV